MAIASHYFSAIGVSKTPYLGGALDPYFSGSSTFAVITQLRSIGELSAPVRRAGTIPVWGSRLRVPGLVQAEPTVFTFTVNLEPAAWRYNSELVGAWSSGLERVFKIAISATPFASMATGTYTGDYVIFSGYPVTHKLGLSTSDATTMTLEILVTSELTPVVRSSTAEVDATIFQPLTINWLASTTDIFWDSSGSAITWTQGLYIYGTPAVQPDGGPQLNLDPLPTSVAVGSTVVMAGDYIWVFTGEDYQAGFMTRATASAVVQPNRRVWIPVEDRVPAAGNVFIGFNRSL